jgi:ketosteroid isomerase-like protein
VTDQLSATERIAQQVVAALAAADLSAFSDLLDPRVRWGAPDDPSPPCQSRSQVLAWYQRGRDAGVRATVCETVAAGDRILVGLRVAGPQSAPEPGGEANRWQVLTVRDGRIVDIVGFDERRDAAARAGLRP